MFKTKLFPVVCEFYKTHETTPLDKKLLRACRAFMARGDPVPGIVKSVPMTVDYCNGGGRRSLITEVVVIDPASKNFGRIGCVDLDASRALERRVFTSYEDFRANYLRVNDRFSVCFVDGKKEELNEEFSAHDLRVIADWWQTGPAVSSYERLTPNPEHHVFPAWSARISRPVGDAEGDSPESQQLERGRTPEELRAAEQARFERELDKMRYSQNLSRHANARLERMARKDAVMRAKGLKPVIRKDLVSKPKIEKHVDIKKVRTGVSLERLVGIRLKMKGKK